jgi:hypothetical protein
MALAVVLYALASWLSLHFAETLKFPEDSPGGAPPWYFIRQDAIQGLCFIPYLAACVGIGLAAIKNRMPGGGTLVWFGVIWSAAPVWRLGVIYLRSDHIFDPARARTAWATFESYIGDPLQWGWIIFLVIGGLLQAAVRIRTEQGASLNG